MCVSEGLLKHQSNDLNNTLLEPLTLGLEALKCLFLIRPKIEIGSKIYYLVEFESLYINHQ